MISVIVPVYKIEQYLPQCIESILNQSYQDIEIILVDDGSPDDCGKICDKYAQKDKRIRVFHKKNGGLSDARNFGIVKAKGDYLGFVDGDDWIELDMYETLLNLIEDNNAELVNGGVYYEYSNRSVIVPIIDRSFNNTIELSKSLIKGEINNGVWNKLYRKSCFSNLEFPKGHVFEDVDIMYQLFLKVTSVVSTSKPLYHYRQKRKGSITETRSMDNLIDYWRAFKLRYYYFMGDSRFNTDKELIDKLYYDCANAIGRTWGWYFACTKQEKKKYASEIKEMHDFCIRYFPLSNMKKIPLRERIPIIIGRCDNRFAFALLYYMLQCQRWVSDKSI